MRSLVSVKLWVWALVSTIVLLSEMMEKKGYHGVLEDTVFLHQWLDERSMFIHHVLVVFLLVE